MDEDDRTKIQQIETDKWMLASTDAYAIDQYVSICISEGKTTLEKAGIFDTREQVETILGKIRSRPFLLGQDPKNRVAKRYGL